MICMYLHFVDENQRDRVQERQREYGLSPWVKQKSGFGCHKKSIIGQKSRGQKWPVAS